MIVKTVNIVENIAKLSSEIERHYTVDLILTEKEEIIEPEKLFK